MKLGSRLAGSAGRLAKWGFYVSVVGMILLATTVFVERWVSWGGDWAWFVIEIPALLLVAPALPVLGLATLRAKVVPPLGGWLLTFAVPGMLPLTLLFGHFSGGLLVLDFAWIVLGYALWSQRDPAPATV